MPIGRLVRIILLILIIGMGTFVVFRNKELKKQKASGAISEIKVKDFLPFTSNILNTSGSQSNETKSEGTPGTQQNITDTKLNKISEHVTGLIFIERPDEIKGEIGKDKNGKPIYDTTLALRYVDQENGFVYDYLPLYKKSYIISDTPIPRIHSALFSPDGSRIIFRYLDKDLSTEKSVLGTLGKGAIEFLPDNIQSFDFKQDNSLLYFKPTQTGSELVLQKNNTKQTIYNSPLLYWNGFFFGEKYVIQTKASETIPGFAYILDTTTQKLSRLFKEEKGLTILPSPNGTYILYSITESAGPTLYLYNTVNGSKKALGKLGMSDKCTFSKDSKSVYCAVPKNFESVLYPDAWYLGEITTNDAIVSYSTENLNERIIVNLEENSGKAFDVLKIASSPSGKDVAFINKKDNSLWIYEE